MKTIKTYLEPYGPLSDVAFRVVFSLIEVLAPALDGSGRIQCSNQQTGNFRENFEAKTGD
jgi:hypothetical protein